MLYITMHCFVICSFMLVLKCTHVFVYMSLTCAVLWPSWLCWSVLPRGACRGILGPCCLCNAAICVCCVLCSVYILFSASKMGLLSSKVQMIARRMKSKQKLVQQVELLFTATHHEHHQTKSCIRQL
jgi:hypothetical protein